MECLTDFTCFVHLAIVHIAAVSKEFLTFFYLHSDGQHVFNVFLSHFSMCDSITTVAEDTLEAYRCSVS